jgi:hypothetical protein
MNHSHAHPKPCHLKSTQNDDFAYPKQRHVSRTHNHIQDLKDHVEVTDPQPLAELLGVK